MQAFQIGISHLAIDTFFSMCFHGLINHFVLVVNKFPLSGYTIFYLYIDGYLGFTSSFGIRDQSDICMFCVVDLRFQLL